MRDRVQPASATRMAGARQVSADRLDFKEVDFHIARFSSSSFWAGPKYRHCQKKLLFILSSRPVIRLSSVLMPRNRAIFWKVGYASSGVVRVHRREGFSCELDLARAGLIEAVQHIEHGGFARSVRPDNGPDFSLPNIKTDIVDGCNPTEFDDNILDGKNRGTDCPCVDKPAGSPA